MSANLPASNKGTFPVSTGTTHNSKFSQKAHSTPAKSMGVSTATAKSPGNGKPNMPANNVNNKTVSMGTTKHAPGSVPGYLKGK